MSYTRIAFRLDCSRECQNPVFDPDADGHVLCGGLVDAASATMDSDTSVSIIAARTVSLDELASILEKAAKEVRQQCYAEGARYEDRNLEGRQNVHIGYCHADGEVSDDGFCSALAAAWLDEYVEDEVY